jgi:hypothetical protein
MVAVIIQEFPNYSINENGEVINIKTNKRLVNTTSKNGYSIVCLYNECGRKMIYVHRLLAEYFIPKIVGMNHVNHKNEIKNDYRLENLEWCNRSINMQHAWDNGLSENVRVANRTKKSKLVLDFNTGIFYDSAKEAANLLGINANTLRAYLSNYYPNKTNLKYV